MKTLLAYASRHGSTGEVANFIGDVLKSSGMDVSVQPVAEIEDISDYNAFVLGSPIYTGAWLPEMAQFIRHFHEQVGDKPVYLWISCIRVLEQYGREHVLEFYLAHELLRKVNLKGIGIFAGRLNLDEIDWNERWTLGARYDGQTWPSSFNGDFRDWEKIRAWSQEVASELT